MFDFGMRWGIPTSLVYSGFTQNVPETGCCFVAYSYYRLNEFSLQVVRILTVNIGFFHID